MSSVQQRPTKTVVVAGASSVGKATLIGNLVYKCGGLDMVRLQELQKAGINKYDSMVKYHKKHGLKLYFETKHANILVQKQEIDGALPDCLVFIDVAGAAPSFAELPGEMLSGKQIILAVNKMDIVDWSEDCYNQAIEAMSGIFGKQRERVLKMPISALHGDNILEPSTNTPWVAQDSTSPVTLIDAIDRAVMA